MQNAKLTHPILIKARISPDVAADHFVNQLLVKRIKEVLEQLNVEVDVIGSAEDMERLDAEDTAVPYPDGELERQHLSFMRDKRL